MRRVIGVLGTGLPEGGIGYAIPMKHKPLDQALDDLRAVPDPYARLAEAQDLDSALVMARSVVAQVKRDTINALRSTTSGYGTIAHRLGLTKARVQQIANAPRNLGLAAAYAFLDEHGSWHGEPGLLPAGQYRESPSFIPFSPADKFNPLGGQVLTVWYGRLDEEHGVSAYTLQIRQENGSPLNLRMTHAVQDALFGPPIDGTPERQRWEAARELRKRELDETD
jgi:hypothetical protein